MPGIGAHDPPEYARDAHTEDFKQYDLDKQLRIYQCGLHREPPDIMLSSYIAKRGESAIPELLKKLENTTDDETKYEIIEVFSSMATWDTCETTQRLVKE